MHQVLQFDNLQFGTNDFQDLWLLYLKARPVRRKTFEELKCYI